MATEVTSVTCNHCGAPLQVPDSTRFVTCSHCGSQLEIHRSGNVVYTEVLERIEQRTERIAEDVSEIRRQNEVERLDREWQMRRDTLLVRDKNGNVSEPSGAGSMIGAGFAAIFGIIWTIVATSAGAPWFFALFGIGFVIAAVVGGFASIGKAATYRDEYQSYLRKRDGLMGIDRDRQ
jgi:hypothetical protein